MLTSVLSTWAVVIESTVNAERMLCIPNALNSPLLDAKKFR